MLNSDASKAEKEAFVTGHTGGEYWEILLLQSLLPVRSSTHPLLPFTLLYHYMRAYNAIFNTKLGVLVD